MASKYKSIVHRCVSFSENLFDYHYYKSDLNLNFETKQFIKEQEFYQFQDKNKKELDIEPNTLIKDLKPKTQKLLQIEGNIIKELNKIDNQIKKNNKMSFIHIWNDYEYFQINLLINFLVLNDEVLKKVISHFEKNSLETPYWKSYFRDKIDIEVKFSYVEYLITKITKKGGIFNRQKLFSLSGIDISDYDTEIVNILQKFRNCISHYNGIMSEEDFLILEKFVNNKDYQTKYTSDMRKYINSLFKKGKKPKFEMFEWQGRFDSDRSMSYYFFKNIHKNIKVKKLKNEDIKIDIRSSDFEYIFLLVFRDMFNKTYNLIKKSDFDFGENGDIIALDNDARIDCFDMIIYNFGSRYIKSVESFDFFDFKDLKKYTKDKFQLPPIQKSGHRLGILFYVGKLIIQNSGLIKTDGDFSIKNPCIRARNYLRVNYLALIYYKACTDARFFDIDIDKGKMYKNWILNNKVFNHIKHNDLSENFETKNGDKSLSLDFKFVKHLLLREFNQAESTLYDCKDLNSDLLVRISTWSLIEDFKKTNKFNEIEKAYGISYKKDDIPESEELVSSKNEIFEA